MRAEREASDESKDNSFSSSDRRSSKRPRVEETPAAEETFDAPPTLASIKDALSRMHERRAMAAAPPAVVLAAVECATAAPAPAPAVAPIAAVVPAKAEEAKAVPFNPMAMGLRNQLMKELDFKLVKRKNQVDASESAPADAMDTDTSTCNAPPSTDASAQTIAQLQEELAQANATIATHECTIETTSAERDEALLRVEVLEACTAEQSDADMSKMAAADELVASLQAQIVEASIQYVSHTAAHTAEMDTIKFEKVQLEEMVASLQTHLATASAQNTTMEQETSAVEALQTENAQLQDEVASLLSQLEDLQATLTKETEGLKQESAQLKESLEASESETLSLLEQLEQAHAQGSDNSQLLQQMKEKDEQLAQTSEALATAQCEIARLKDELQVSVSALSQLQESHAATIESIQCAHTEALESLQAGHLATITDLQSTTAAQLETIASLETARAADAESVSAMEVKMAEIIEQGLLAEEHLEAARDSVTELQGMLSASEDKVSEVMTELSTAHSASADLEANLRHAQEMYATSQEELAAVQARVIELESALQAAEEAASSVPLVDTVTVEQMLEMQAALEAEKAKSASSAEELASTQAEVAEQAALVERLTEELSAVVERAEAVQAEKSALEQRVEALEGEVQENATNSKANGDIITELEASLVQSLNDQQAVEEELANANASLEDLKASHEELSEQVTTLQAQLVEAEGHLQAAIATAASTPTTSGAGVARLSEFDMDQQTLDASRKDTERLVANVKAELGSKEAEISRLMAALAEAQQRAIIAEQRVVSSDNAFDQSDIEGTKKRVNQLQTTVDLLSGEKDSMVLKLQQAEKELKSREGAAAVAIEKLERDIVGLNRQIEKLSQEAAQAAIIQQNAVEIKHRLEDMVALRDQHQQRADAAVKHIQALELQIEQLGSNAPVAQDSAETRGQMLELQQDISELSTRLKKSQDATAQLREQWEQAEAERVAAVAQLANAEADKAALVSDLEAAMDNINSLTDALEEATNEAEAAAAPATTGIAMQPITENDEALALLEDEVAQLKSEKELTALEAEVLRDELAQKIEQLQYEVSNITERLIGSESTAQSLREEICILQETGKQDAAELYHLSGLTKHQAHQVAELMGQLEDAQRNGNQSEKLNELMSQLQEAKEAAAKVDELEGEVANLQDALAAADLRLEELSLSSAAERDALCTEYEVKMALLTEQLTEKEEELSAVSAENARLLAETDALTQELSAQQAKNVSLTNTVSELQGELEDAKDQSTGAASEAVETLQGALSAAKSELQTAREDLRAANEHCAVNEDVVANLQEQLQVKETRIVHLEACKLTKEQMEKIKVIKEERKKFQEDAKVLKKQLHQLTIKYEELRQSAKQASENRANGVGGGPSTDYVISDLRVQLVTANEALATAQGEVKRVKGKLVECANQLKMYESDQAGIVAVLEKYGVDTRSLIPLDHSVDEDSSSMHGDIADAVGQLGEKLDAAKAQVSRREASKSEKAAELEERLAQQVTETQEALLQKANLEKRLEVLKASAKTARETSTAMTLEIESLTARVAELKDELSSAQKRVASSSDVASSEVQALEEENIELLKENKDLRIQVSRLKAGNPAPAPSSMEGIASVLSPVPMKAPASVASGALSGHKRAFGTDISNTAPTASSSSAATGEVSKTGTSVLSESQLDDANKGKSRRTRMKAKALVDESAAASQDEAAECKQS